MKLRKLRSLTRPTLKYVVGNGRKIFIWHDNHHPKGRLLRFVIQCKVF